MSLESPKTKMIPSESNYTLPHMRVTDYLTNDGKKKDIIMKISDWKVLKSGWLIRNDPYSIKNKTRNIKGILDIEHSKEIYIHPLSHIEHQTWRLNFIEIRGNYIFFYVPDCISLAVKRAGEIAHQLGLSQYNISHLESAIEDLNKTKTANFFENVPLTLVQYAHLSQSRTELIPNGATNGFNDNIEHIQFFISGPGYGSNKPQSNGKKRPDTIELEILLPADLDPDGLINRPTTQTLKKNAALRKEVTYEWVNAIRRQSNVVQPLERIRRHENEPTVKVPNRDVNSKQIPSTLSNRETNPKQVTPTNSSTRDTSIKQITPTNSSAREKLHKTSTESFSKSRKDDDKASKMLDIINKNSKPHKSNRTAKVLQLWNKAKKTKEIFVFDEDKLNKDLKTVKPIDGAIPTLLHQCIEIIEEQGLDVEGIYRLSGSSSAVKTLRQAYGNNNKSVNILGNNKLWNGDIHVLTGCVKGYLRDGLQPWDDSLCMYEHYDDFIQVAQISSDDLRLLALKELIHRLKSNNFSTLKFLLQHLYKVSQHSSSNKMTIRNLAIVFGPTVLQTKIPSPNMLADMQHQCLIVEIMISNIDFIFNNGESSHTRGKITEEEINRLKAAPMKMVDISNKENSSQHVPARSSSHQSSENLDNNENNHIRLNNNNHNNEVYSTSKQNTREDTTSDKTKSYNSRISSREHIRVNSNNNLQDILENSKPVDAFSKQSDSDKIVTGTSNTDEVNASEEEDQVYSEEDFSMDFERVKKVAPRLSLHLSTIGSGNLGIDFKKLSLE